MNYGPDPWSRPVQWVFSELLCAPGARAYGSYPRWAGVPSDEEYRPSPPPGGDGTVPGCEHESP